MRTKTRPVEVKKSIVAWVEATKSFQTSSSSLDRHAAAPAATAPLRAVGRGRGTFDVPAAGHGDHHFLFGDQILDGDLARVVDDLGAPGVAESFFDLGELFDDDLGHHLVGIEDRLEVGDELADLGVLFDDLVAFEPGQALQSHVEDRLRLNLRKAKLSISPPRAASGSAAPRIRAITASRLSRAMTSPSRMWTRSRARARS